MPRGVLVLMSATPACLNKKSPPQYFFLNLRKNVSTNKKIDPPTDLIQIFRFSRKKERLEKAAVMKEDREELKRKNGEW
jgi:hypothetical protein